MLKVGFVGAGNRARLAHYPNVSRLEDVSIEGVAELDESLARGVMEQYEIPRYYTSHTELIETDIDAVYVNTNATIDGVRPLMAPIAVDALNAGKHVFIEKPPGANLADTQRILDAAVANDVYCTVGYQRRFSAVTKEAMRLVNSRGGPTLGVALFHKILPDGMVGSYLPSTLWTDVCHVLDTLRYSMQSEAVEVTAYQDSHHLDWTNSYNALMRFANNGVAVLAANYSSGGRAMRMELHGPGIGCYYRPDGSRPEPLEILDEGKELEVRNGAELAGVSVDDQPAYEGVLEMHRHFAECIRDGKTPINDIRDVINTSRLLDQIEGNSG